MPKQILLVDDSVTIHRVVEITFAQEDFAITAVKNADEGLERAKQLKPDIVTTRFFTTCFTGVVVPFVCTTGSAACGQ